MNICLFGATGRVGSVILENALADRHIVKALVRNLEKSFPADNNLKVIRGDVVQSENIAAVMSGCDVVVSSLNTDGGTVLSESMPLIIQQMKAMGLKRIITIGTAGILQARTEPHLYRFQSSESRRTTTRDAEEHLKAYLILKESGLDWTVVCPTYLPLGERVGRFRYEVDFLPDGASSISIFDTGDFAYQQINSKELIGCRVGLGY